MDLREHVQSAIPHPFFLSWYPQLISHGVIAYAAFWLIRAVYRLTLHPLATFPGPRSAAISVWWLYRVESRQHIELELRALHKKYGSSILRIGPNELHIDDSSVYDKIYSAKYRFLKEPTFYAQFSAPHTAFSEASPALHRERRKLLNPFFSKQGIASLQDLLETKVDLMIDKIVDYQGKGAIHIYSAIRCLTVDVISEYSFGTAFDLLDKSKDNTFRPDLLLAFDLVLESLLNMRYFPLLRIMSNYIPSSVMGALDKNVAKFIELKDSLEVARVKFNEARSDGTKFDRLPLFEPLSSLPVDMVRNEAVNIIIAGSDTTATSLGNLIYEVLSDPKILRRLTDELDLALPSNNSDWSLAKLEQLDYLTACIKETLRYGVAVQGRLPRIVPTSEKGSSPLTVDGKIIPSGTIVGMSAMSVHFDESVWGADCQTYNPERWLQPDSKKLDRYMVVFSKGARQCIGINMAYAELRIATAKLFRRLDMHLDGTMTKRDLNQLDCFTTSFEGTGVRVFIRGQRP